MTHTELAWEFAEVFADLEIDEINQVLAQNVPFETLEFFNAYAGDFANRENIPTGSQKKLPNLLLLGYLLRVLEERLISE